MYKQMLLRFCALACVLILFSCDQKTVPLPKTAFANTDVTGLDYGKDFSLTDHNGKPRTMADFRGKLVFVFFGYTHCPDICPTTLSDMTGIMKALGPDADKLQVLFITLDPERDTPEVMAGFVPAFPRMVQSDDADCHAGPSPVWVRTCPFAPAAITVSVPFASAPTARILTPAKPSTRTFPATWSLSIGAAVPIPTF